MAQEILQQKWQELAARFSTDQPRITDFWQELEHAYSHKNRHYHTLQHVYQLFRLANEYQVPVENPIEFECAIFYHDAVYNASRNDNEEKSANLAAKRLKALDLPAAQIEHVTKLILATKTHQLQSDPDSNILVDLDLSILGAPWPDYQAYLRQIRQEYRLYPDFLYNPGRKKVLLHFLEQDQIYKTESFRNLWETAARRNLGQELKLLT